MFHAVNNVTNERGDGLASYRIKLKVPGGAYTPLYSDESGTPIIGVSGIADTAVTDENGLYDFWVDEEEYDLEVYDDSGDFVRRFEKLGFIQRGVGTAANNSGMVTTIPAGAASAKVGHSITGGGGAFGADKGIVIEMANNTLSALDIHTCGSGHNVRFFDVAGVIETYIGEGNQLETRKWIGIYARRSTENGSPGDANYHRIFLPPNEIPHMFGIDADVMLAESVRGANVAVQMAKLYQMNDGDGTRLDMMNGALRFARTDSLPFIGDGDTAGIDEATFLANYSTYFPISFEPHNAGGVHGMRLRSYDVGTIGETALFLGANGAIVNLNGRIGLQNEAGSVWQVGNDTDFTTINGAQIDVDGVLKLKSYTVAQLTGGTPLASSHVGGMVYVSNGAGNKRLAISDGTDWRFPDGAVVS